MNSLCYKSGLELFSWVKWNVSREWSYLIVRCDEMKWNEWKPIMIKLLEALGKTRSLLVPRGGYRVRLGSRRVT